MIDCAVQTRPRQGIAQCNSGEVRPVKPDVSESDRQWCDENSVDIATIKNRTESPRGHVRFAQPEFLQFVTVAHARLRGSLEKILVDAKRAPTIAARKVRQKSDRESVSNHARGAAITHQR